MMSIVTLCATLPDSKVPRVVDVYRHCGVCHALDDWCNRSARV